MMAVIIMFALVALMVLLVAIYRLTGNPVSAFLFMLILGFLGSIEDIQF